MSTSLHTRPDRLAVTAFAAKYILSPVGDGKSDHLDGEFSLPGAIELVPGLYEVGRMEPADIVLEIPTISSRHCLLRVEEEEFIVTDLESTNGTVVDGEQLKAMNSTKVEPGSVIVFGDPHLAAFTLEQVKEESAEPDKEEEKTQ